jgi:integrase
MATIRKRNGKFQVQIRIKGKRPVTGSFDTAAKAKSWARDQEAKLRAGVAVITPQQTHITLKDVILRVQYAPTYSTAVNHCLSDPISSLAIVDITKDIVHGWLRRIAHLKESTQAKYLNVPRMAWNYAEDAMDFKFPRKNPFTKLGVSKSAPHRTRRLVRGEYALLMDHALPLSQDFITWAIETAMRRGEITRVRASHFSEDYRFLLISKTKTGKPRTIPLSLKAQEIAKRRAASGDRIFPISPSRVTFRFNKICRLAGIQGLTFHDLRHEALSRLSDKGHNTLEMMTVSGHTNPKQLAEYVQPDLEKLYAKLNGKRYAHAKTRTRAGGALSAV